jgi:hypothetical protein
VIFALSGGGKEVGPTDPWDTTSCQIPQLECLCVLQLQDRQRHNSVIAALSAGGQSGLLASLMQRAIGALVKTGHQPSSGVSIAFVEALFAVILQLVNSTAGCQALASAGLIPNFLPMLKDHEPEHYSLVIPPNLPFTSLPLDILHIRSSAHTSGLTPAPEEERNSHVSVGRDPRRSWMKQQPKVDACAGVLCLQDPGDLHGLCANREHPVPGSGGPGKDDRAPRMGNRARQPPAGKGRGSPAYAVQVTGRDNPLPPAQPDKVPDEGHRDLQLYARNHCSPPGNILQPGSDLTSVTVLQTASRNRGLIAGLASQLVWN